MIYLFLTSFALAADLAGVSMPDSIVSGKTKLHLNGIGLREKFLLDIYVVGMYIPQKNSDFKAEVTTLGGTAKIFSTVEDYLNFVNNWDYESDAGVIMYK